VEGLLQPGRRVRGSRPHVSRLVFDQVTELPERANFQATLEAALARVEEKSRPAVLLLLGPDDFGWVNDRLD
jgi:PleD family two-component response regulator